MPKVVMLLADGFEEVEAIGIADVLRRAGIETVLAGLREGQVTGAHNVRVLPDAVIDSILPEEFDMLVLPGGQPGADNLNADPRVRALITEFSQRGRLLGAICAAPYVLAEAGVLTGLQATSYPSYKDRLGTADYRETSVVEHGNVMTSRGPGTALCFGLAIAKRLAGPEKAEQVRSAMLIQDRCDS
ncbi:MAG: DJ-1/PfpI family protein [Thermodesulfovibrionales bacterium]